MEFEDAQKLAEPQMIVETIVSRHGQQTNNLYSRGRFLRESQNARQYEVQELTTSEVMTAKIISKAFINKNKTRQKLLAEIKNHRKFAHSNILKFKHVFEDQENVYLLVERIPNGNLEELLGRRVRLSQQQVQYYFNRMVEILVELRERRVLHRDIRLDCLYLDANMILKLGDFGESCEYTGERRRSILKLTHFTSPEIINQLGHSYETDLWSVGVVTYTLLTGEEPFKSGESFSLSKIRNANFMFPPGLIINPKWKDILKRILVADAGERITLDALRQMKFTNAPHYLPTCLLNATNRLEMPPTNQNRNSKFLNIFNANFRSDEHGEDRSDNSSMMVDRESKIRFNQHTSGDTRMEVWQLNQQIGLVYSSEKFLCINFMDGSTLIGSKNLYEYRSANGSIQTLSQEEAKRVKVTAKKIPIFKHIKQQLKLNLDSTEGQPAPVLVESYNIVDSHLIMRLTNKLYQILPMDNFKQYIVLDQKGKQTYYKNGFVKQADQYTNNLYKFVAKQLKKGTFKLTKIQNTL